MVRASRENAENLLGKLILLMFHDFAGSGHTSVGEMITGVDVVHLAIDDIEMGGRSVQDHQRLDHLCLYIFFSLPDPEIITVKITCGHSQLPVAIGTITLRFFIPELKTLVQVGLSLVTGDKSGYLMMDDDLSTVMTLLPDQDNLFLADQAVGEMCPWALNTRTLTKKRTVPAVNDRAQGRKSTEFFMGGLWFNNGPDKIP